MVRERLASERPGDAVVGEEYGVRGDAERCWVVDPIDGTKNFVRGAPVWATLLALRSGADTVVGVVSAPALGRRWWAARGNGAYVNGAPITVSGVRRLADAVLSYTDWLDWRRRGLGDGFDALARSCWGRRGWSDFWGHMLVAEGVADVMAEPELALWDLAAVQLVVEEAGGRCTDLGGVARPDGGSGVSTNGALHDEVLALLRQERTRGAR